MLNMHFDADAAYLAAQSSAAPLDVTRGGLHESAPQ